MGQIGDVREIQAARKRHLCWWCGEHIKAGDPYARWVWCDDGELLPVKVHPECREAWKSLDYGDNEVMFADFCRGCTCERGYCRCVRDREALNGDGDGYGDNS